MIEKNEPRRLARRWHRKVIDQRDARLRQLERERNRLSRLLRVAPLIELEEPYQRGWVRYFDLKPEALRRRDGNWLREVVTLIECRQYCRTGKWKAWSHRRKRIVLVRHLPRRFTPTELMRIHPPHQLLKYFASEHHGIRVNSYERLLWLLRNSYGGRLRFIYPEILIEVVEPYMITHTRTHYPEVERRLAEIERAFEAGGRHRLSWLKGYRSYRHWDKQLIVPVGEKDARRDMRDQLRDVIKPSSPAPTTSPITLIEAEEGAGDRAFFVSKVSKIAVWANAAA